MFSKEEYIIQSISKTRHKKWEHYVVTRIVHLLDDPEIEFVTQQLVLTSSGRKLTDLYFPQFNIHVEVDEEYHEGELQRILDKKRSQDIIKATQHDIHRIKVNSGPSNLSSIEFLNQQVDDFIRMIKNLKEKKISNGDFFPWDYEFQFSPEKHILKGSISSTDDVFFRCQNDALQCFGYGKGRYRRGLWRIPDKSGDAVWFPRLYKIKEWSNELSKDGDKIIERPHSSENFFDPKKSFHKGNRITFAKYSDSLGQRLYRYVGTFKINLNASKSDEIQYDLVKKSENLDRKNKTLAAPQFRSSSTS